MMALACMNMNAAGPHRVTATRLAMLKAVGVEIVVNDVKSDERLVCRVLFVLSRNGSESTQRQRAKIK